MKINNYTTKKKQVKKEFMKFLLSISLCNTNKDTAVELDFFISPFFFFNWIFEIIQFYLEFYFYTRWDFFQENFALEATAGM